PWHRLHRRTRQDCLAIAEPAMRSATPARGAVLRIDDAIVPIARAQLLRPRSARHDARYRLHAWSSIAKLEEAILAPTHDGAIGCAPDARVMRSGIEIDRAIAAEIDLHWVRSRRRCTRAELAHGVVAPAPDRVVVETSAREFTPTRDPQRRSRQRDARRPQH